MVFSSITFIYYFLPIVIFCYFIVPKKFKNFILLLCSLFFYFFGEKEYIVILLLSCLINFFSAILIDKFPKCRKIFLILAISFNLILLGYFKYTNFLIDNINKIFNSNISLLNIVMPLGISFFTFQTLSYVIDVYNNKVKADYNFINFTCYVALFPQLVAGPIVRYSDISSELRDRKVTIDTFSSGVKRFIIGLTKKVIIANSIGEMINILNSLDNPSVLSHIIVAIGFTYQIYFDFSGYSDMAIGLGRMFGFHFPENFNYPFISKNVTEFWRRWHISLSNFFKDYVYIPLGGNKKNNIITIRNILIVWLLTGLWHGATWNFVLWGLFFGIILIIEKYLLKKFLNKHVIFSYIYTFIIILISFVIFNTENISDTIKFLSRMFSLSNIPFINDVTMYYFKSYFVLLLISIISATPLIKLIYNKCQKANHFIFDVFEVIILFGLLIINTAYLIDSSFNPFLYFRF